MWRLRISVVIILICSTAGPTLPAYAQDTTRSASKSVSKPVTKPVAKLSQAIADSMCHAASSLDERICYAINQLGAADTAWDPFAIAVSNSAVIAAVGVPVGFYTYGRLQTDIPAIYTGLSTALTEVSASAVTELLKVIVHRARPFHSILGIRIPDLGATGYSFPSGHATISWALATSVSLHYPKWYVIAPSAIYATVVSLSRPYLGVHYPSDIIVGALIGSGMAVLVKSLEHPLFSHTKWLFPRGTTDAMLAEPTDVKIIVFHLTIP